MGKNGNSPEAIQVEIDRLKADLQATQAAIESAAAGDLGNLSIKAAGLQSALPILGQRKRAADIAEIDAQIAQFDDAARAAQKVAQNAQEDFQIARQAYDDARPIMSKAPLFDDKDIDRIVVVTANQTRADLILQRANYAMALPRDRIRQLKVDRAELASEPITF
jgi:uncharacterized protein YydD (DUF2326 family)